MSIVPEFEGGRLRQEGPIIEPEVEGGRPPSGGPCL
jgi:hypothetical protein